MIERGSVQTPPGPPVRRVALAGAIAGAALGMLAATPQVAVEPAQVLAGIVTYPPGNPFHLYELRLWTLWHQLLAGPLAAGVDERLLSIAVSGAVGAIAFTALSVLALASGARPLLALAVPFTLVHFDFGRWGFRYPILLIGHPHTYGMAGLAWIVLVLGVFAAGRVRIAAFLLGLAPAVHPSLGATFLAGVALAALIEPRRSLRMGAIGPGLAGLALSVLSLLVQRLAFPADSSIDPAEAERYLGAFVRLWDAHRQPLSIADWNVRYVACAVAFALVLLVRGRSGTPLVDRFALRVYLACALAGIGVNLVLAFVPVDAVPAWVLVAMPARFLNFAALAFLPMAIGVADRTRDGVVASLFLLAVPAVTVAQRLSAAVEPIGSILLCGMAVAVACEATGLWASSRQRGAQGIGSISAAARGAAMILFVASIVVAGFLAIRSAPARLAQIRGPGNDPALAQAARGHGLLVPGPTILMAQLGTRRPVLLDPEALDMLPYAIAGAPAFEAALRDVYGIDFFDPPPQALHGAVVPPGIVRKKWEARTLQEWSALRERHGITEVLVRPGWKLRLPEIARSRFFALFRIPEAAPHEDSG